MSNSNWDDFEMNELKIHGEEAYYYHTLRAFVDLIVSYGLVTVVTDLMSIVEDMEQ